MMGVSIHISANIELIRDAAFKGESVNPQASTEGRQWNVGGPDRGAVFLPIAGPYGKWKFYPRAGIDEGCLLQDLRCETMRLRLPRLGIHPAAAVLIERHALFQ